MTGITKIYAKYILFELFSVLFYRKRLAVLSFSCPLVLGFIAAVSLPPRYESSAKYIISISENLDPLQQEHNYDIKNKTTSLIQNQKEIIFSKSVLEGAIKKVYPVLDGIALDETATKVKKRITVAPPKGEDFEGSNVYYLTFEAHDPQQAYTMACALSEAYLEAYAAITRLKSSYSYDFFKSQADDLEAEMERKERKLRRYEIRHATSLHNLINMESEKGGEVGPQALRTQAISQVFALQQQLDTNRAVIDALERAAKTNDMPVMLPEMEDAGKSLGALRNRVAQLQIQLNELRAQFSPSYPLVKQTAREIASDIQLIRSEFYNAIKTRRVQSESLQAQIDQLNNTISGLDKAIATTTEERSVYEGLKHEYRLAASAFSAANDKLNQARMASSVNEEKKNIIMVDAPSVATSPHKPNRLMIAVLGILVGFFLGIGVPLLADIFDHTIKSSKDIENALGVPCLGSIARV